MSQLMRLLQTQTVKLQLVEMQIHIPDNLPTPHCFLFNRDYQLPSFCVAYFISSDSIPMLHVRHCSRELYLKTKLIQQKQPHYIYTSTWLSHNWSVYFYNITLMLVKNPPLRSTPLSYFPPLYCHTHFSDGLIQGSEPDWEKRACSNKACSAELERGSAPPSMSFHFENQIPVSHYPLRLENSICKQQTWLPPSHLAYPEYREQIHDYTCSVKSNTYSSIIWEEGRSDVNSPMHYLKSKLWILWPGTLAAISIILLRIYPSLTLSKWQQAFKK